MFTYKRIGRFISLQNLCLNRLGRTKEQKYSTNKETDTLFLFSSRIVNN